MNEWMNEWMNQSINQSNQSIKSNQIKSMNQSIDQTKSNQWIDESIQIKSNHSTNQTINK